MGITYNKEFQSKDRRIMSRGPRDRQLKQAHDKEDSSMSVIIELTNKIQQLQEQLDKKDTTPVSGLTDDQVNIEIEKAIKEETSNLKNKFELEKQSLNNKISILEKEILSIREIIKSKDEIIKQLKTNKPETDNKLTELLTEATKKIEIMASQMNTGTSNISDSSGRPKMETAFVDPIEKESVMEKFIEVEDISINEKEVIDNKVDKLRSLLGKLPNKK